MNDSISLSIIRPQNIRYEALDQSIQQNGGGGADSSDVRQLHEQLKQQFQKLEQIAADQNGGAVKKRSSKKRSSKKRPAKKRSVKKRSSKKGSSKKGSSKKVSVKKSSGG